MKQRHQQLLHLLARQEWIKGRELASCPASAQEQCSDIEQIEKCRISFKWIAKRISPFVALPNRCYADPERRTSKSSTR